MRPSAHSPAVRLYEARGGINVVESAPRVATRTLVAHAREDQVVPVDEGRLLGALIPGARLVLLESARLRAAARAAAAASYSLREGSWPPAG